SLPILCPVSRVTEEMTTPTVGPLTCQNAPANGTSLSACHGHGGCVLQNGGVDTWECHCAKYWLAATQCATTHFAEIGKVYALAPLVHLLTFLSFILFFSFLLSKT